MSSTRSRASAAVDVLLIAVATALGWQALQARDDRRLLIAQDDWMTLVQNGDGPSVAAELIIVEFTDYLCPGCASVEPVLAEIERDFPGRVRRVVRHFPLTGIHPRADSAAFLAECARDQGKFQAAHRALFEHPALTISGSWDSLAVLAGVPSLSALGDCLKAHEVKQRIAQDMALGRRMGVNVTPTIIVNRELMRDAPSAIALRARLKERLR